MRNGIEIESMEANTMSRRSNLRDHIRAILCANPSGISISDVARKANVSRNTAAKYLGILLASGEVEVNAIGSAKVYSISGRMPLSSILNSTSDNIAVMDQHLRVVRANGNFLRLLNMDQDELIGRSATEVASSFRSSSDATEILDEVLVKLDNALEGKHVVHELSAEIDGKEKHFSMKLVPTKFENGEYGVTAIFEDTTERKLAQNAAVHQRDFLEKVIESLIHPFYVIDVHNHRVKIANKSANFGPLTEDSKCYYLTHWRDKPCTGLDHPCPLNEVKRTKKPVIVEHAHYDIESGRVRFFEVHGIPIFDSRENVVQMIEYNLDITEHKIAKRKVRSGEVTFQSFIEQSTDGIALADENGLVVEWNAVLEHITGMTRSQAIGQYIWEVIVNYMSPEKKSQETAQRIRNWIITALENGEVPLAKSPYTFDVVLPDGDIRVIQVSMFPINTDTGYMLGSILRDVTDRHRAVTEIRRSEKKYRTLYENMPDGFVRCDLDGKFLEFNKSYLEIVGYSSDELQELTFWDISPVKWHEMEQKVINEQILPYGYCDVFEKEYEKKDGSVASVEVRIHAELDDEGQMIGTWALVRDITKRKHVETELEKSKNKYRHLFNSSRDGIVFTTMEGFFMEANPAFIEMTGYDMAELRSLTYHQLTPEHWLKNEAKIHEAQVMKRGYSDEYEKEYIRKDGTAFLAMIRTWLLRDDEDNPVGVVAMIRDITERKKVREALRDSEEQYQLTLNSISDALFVVDDELRIVLTNQAFERWCGTIGVNEKVIGMEIYEAFPFFQMKLISDYQHILKTGEVLHTSNSIVVAGIEHLTEMSKIPIFRTGSVAQVLTIVKNT
ncbi:MAG: PAS domain S-box protein [Candidatus Thorarchaeota archaeon]